MDKGWGLVINGKTIVVGGTPEVKPHVTRAGTGATVKDAVVGDDVVVDYTYVYRVVHGVGNKATGTYVPVVRAVSLSPASPGANAVGNGEAEQKKKKAIANAASVKFYQDKAEKGDAYGQYRMGMYYLKGESVPTDLDKARDYFSKAAAQGNQEAATELAKLSAPEPPVRTNSPPKKGEDR